VGSRSRNRSPTSISAAGPDCPRSARRRQGGHWTASLALASGEAVYGLGEKFGPLNKRGQLVHSHVDDALGVNTGLSYKNAPFAWSPGCGKGAWGLFVHTTSTVTHGVGHPDWSHRSYVLDLQDEALDSFCSPPMLPPAFSISTRSSRGARRRCRRGASGLWVSRAYYKTPKEAATSPRSSARTAFRAT
jgi:alpha-D-xyloside xylohydrolase